MCFLELTHYFFDYFENICTSSYYHHQIGNMNHQTLFRVRSWNYGMRYMSRYACTFVASTWSTDGLAPLGARTSVSTVMIKVMTYITYIYIHIQHWHLKGEHFMINYTYMYDMLRIPLSKICIHVLDFAIIPQSWQEADASRQWYPSDETTTLNMRWFYISVLPTFFCAIFSFY